MSSVYESHGAFSWSELATSDPDAAKKFYGEVFGWRYESMPMEDGEYNVAMAGEDKVAGIMAIPPQAAGAPSNWGCYVTVDDVDATAAKVEALGGSVIVPPMDIPKVGRFFMFKDPQGAMISAIKYLEGEC